MRINLTTFLLILALTQVSARSYSQKINLTETGISLSNAFRSIEKQTGFVFFSTDYDLKNTRIDLSLKEASLDEALRECLKDLPLSYRIVDKTIVIYSETRPSLPDTASLSGTITDENGFPLGGAIIWIEKPQKRIGSDANGRFLFSALPFGLYTLHVTYIGYQDYSASVTVKQGNNKISIVLKTEVRGLEETVIRGYYTTTNRLNTGAVSTVKNEAIEKQPVADVLQSIAALMPGLEISQNSGIAGSGYSSIQIRGVNSLGNNLNTSSSPLFLIDGVQVSGKNDFEYGINPLNSISPADVESVTVLKDADATAIYGSRGANGVILITTKKGKKGKVQITANISGGMNYNSYAAKLLNTEQYLSMRREAFRNDGDTPDELTAPDLFGYGIGADVNRYTDFQKALTEQRGTMTTSQLSFTGGDERTTFLIGGNFHRETPSVPGDFSFIRPAFNFNTTHSSADKRFMVSLSGNYAYRVSNFAVEDVSYHAYELPPNLPDPVNPDGSFNFSNEFVNPYAILAQPTKNSNKDLIANTTVSYLVLTGLTAKASLGYTDLRKQIISYTPLNTVSPAAGLTSGAASFVQTIAGSWQIEPQLEYNKAFGDHNVSATLGGTYQSLQNETQLTNARNYSIDANLYDYSLAADVTVRPYFSLYKYLGVYGRLNYNYRNRYILNLTARRDGSSRFGPGKQFGNFGAAGLAWIFSDEQGLKDKLPWLSFGKLRLSYGIAGNDQIGDYQYLNTYSGTIVPAGIATVSGLVYDGKTPISPTALYNPDFGWETTKKLDAGLDLGFLDDRILFSTNWYHNRSSSQLISYALPSSTGFSGILRNFPAVVGNQGWEFDLKVTAVKNASFNWNSSLNLSIPRNELVSFPGLEQSTYANRFVIGQPISVVKVFKYLGVDKQTGIYTFADRSGNPVANPVANLDQQSYVNTDRRYYGGFNNIFSYRGFQLTVLAQFIRQKAYDPMITYMPPGVVGNFTEQTSSRWQNPGDDTNVQKFTQNPGSEAYTAAINATMSERAYIDASFIRIRNIALSYDISGRLLDRVGFKQFRVFANAQNLFTISGFPGNDPEIGGRGSLPVAKSIVTGLQCSF